MAYDPSALRKVFEIPNYFAIWHYRSTDDLAAVNTSGYIADGALRGMRPGDLLIVDDSNSSARQVSFATVNDLATDAADVGAGLDITATDGD